MDKLFAAIDGAKAPIIMLFFILIFSLAQPAALFLVLVPAGWILAKSKVTGMGVKDAVLNRLLRGTYGESIRERVWAKQKKMDRGAPASLNAARRLHDSMLRMLGYRKAVNDMEFRKRGSDLTRGN
jgi:hypothetical protein